MGKLSGKVALVTGGASGIGRAGRWRSRRKGAAVGIVDRNRPGRAKRAEAMASSACKAVGGDGGCRRRGRR